MQITRATCATTPGPHDWFTGDVWIDHWAEPSRDSPIGAALVRFAPGARTAWHTHPHGQTIVVLDGVGVCQRRGGPVEVIRPGDRVFFSPGEDHWHGAHPQRFMAHAAVHQADEAGATVVWGEHVSEAEYLAAPALEP